MNDTNVEEIYSKVIKDSISIEGIRITTLEISLPKYLDAEFEKHRMLSSNSSSSRAIPFSTGVKNATFIPKDIRKNQKGMQGYETLNEEEYKHFFYNINEIREKSIEILTKWENVVHKQHLNRYIEPWTLQKKVVTATEWDNFFTLRCAKNAQPEMQILANCMKRSMEKSIPQKLVRGDWHLPYVGEEERETTPLVNNLIKSVARCARVSYLLHTKENPSFKDDERLYNLLTTEKHWTPTEHQATPMPLFNFDKKELFGSGISHIDYRGHYWSGNFRGWIQYRKQLEMLN